MMRVWRLSVAYIGPKSRKERSRKTKIGTEVAHVTRDSDTTFKVKRSKVSLQEAGAHCGGLPHSLLQLYLCLTVQQSNLYCPHVPQPVRASWIFWSFSERRAIRALGYSVHGSFAFEEITNRTVWYFHINYLREGSYVFTCVWLSICLSVYPFVC